MFLVRVFTVVGWCIVLVYYDLFEILGGQGNAPAQPARYTSKSTANIAISPYVHLIALQMISLVC